MKRFLFLLVLLVLGCSCSAGAPRVSAPEHDAISTMNDATAILLARDEDKHPDRICAAVWVGQVDLLTAAHCARALGGRDNPIGASIEYARRVDAAGKEIDAIETNAAIVVAIDEDADLALLSARRRVHAVAHVYEGKIDQGASVLTLGHTRGLPYSLSPGVIGADRTMVRYDEREVHVLQVVTGANHGDSGGGVWTEGGELLGICSFRLEDTTLVFYTHRDLILAFLRREAVL